MEIPAHIKNWRWWFVLILVVLPVLVLASPLIALGALEFLFRLLAGFFERINPIYNPSPQWLKDIQNWVDKRN